jgi:hypothetical protein
MRPGRIKPAFATATDLVEARRRDWAYERMTRGERKNKLQHRREAR